MRSGIPVLASVLAAWWFVLFIPRFNFKKNCLEQRVAIDFRLVAPIIPFNGSDPVAKSPTNGPGNASRLVWVPPGSWQDGWSGEVVAGPKNMEVKDCPLDQIPIWCKDLDACPGRSNPPSLNHHSGRSAQAHSFARTASHSLPRRPQGIGPAHHRAWGLDHRAALERTRSRGVSVPRAWSRDRRCSRGERLFAVGDGRFREDLDMCHGRYNLPSLNHQAGAMRRITRSRDCLRRTVRRPVRHQGRSCRTTKDPSDTTAEAHRGDRNSYDWQGSNHPRMAGADPHAGWRWRGSHHDAA